MKAFLATIPFLIAAGLAAQSSAEQAGRDIAPIERKLAAGVEENRLGLLSSRTPGTAMGHFTNAYDQLGAARRAWTVADTKHGAETRYAEALHSLDTRIAAATSTSLLNLGSLTLVRGQHNKALGYVNALLAVDPNNSEAKAMRARIEVSANESTWIGGTGNVQGRLGKQVR